MHRASPSDLVTTLFGTLYLVTTLFATFFSTFLAALFASGFLTIPPVVVANDANLTLRFFSSLDGQRSDAHYITFAWYITLYNAAVAVCAMYNIIFCRCR